MVTWASGNKFFDRIGQQVGGGVANDFQAIGILRGNDGQRALAVIWKLVSTNFAIDLASQGRFGKTSTNGGSYFGHGYRAGKVTYRTVGKRNLNHDVFEKRVMQKSKKRGMVRALL
jgi:hypothetical protein